MKAKKYLTLVLAFILVIGITSIQAASTVFADVEVSVNTLADLQTAITNAGTEPTTIILTARIVTTGDVNIDGAGKNITILRGFNNGTGADAPDLFRINSGTLTLANITLDGNRSAFPNAGAPLVLVSGGTFIMNDGAVLQSNQRTNGNGGGVNVSSGTFTMNSGKIINNTGANNGGGVAVSFPNTFNMNGGEISGNAANMGSDRGGLWIDSGTTVNISGGRIINNGIFMQGGTLTFNNDYTLESLLTLSWDITVRSGTNGPHTVTRGVGGNLITYGGSNTFTSENIIINGNKENFPDPGGSLIRMNNGILNLSGEVVVDNNAGSNVFLANNRYITLSTTIPLAAGSRIGVTKTDNDGVFLQNGASATDVDFFFSDDAAKCVVFDDGALKLDEHTSRLDNCTVCEICGMTNLERTCDPAAPCVLHRGITAWNFTNATENHSGTGWAWNNETRTLTLTNLTHSTTATNALRLPVNATIVLNGASSITAASGGSSTFYTYGIVAEGIGMLNITGNGELFVTTGVDTSDSSTGIRCYGLVISDGARVTANGANLSGTSPSISSIGVDARGVIINGGELRASGGSTLNGKSFGVLGAVIFNGGIFIAEAGLSNNSERRAVLDIINTNTSGYRYKMGADSGVSYIGSSTPIVNDNSAYIELTTARNAINFSSAVSFVTNESIPQTVTLNPANTNIPNTAEGWIWEQAPRILTLHGAYINGNLTVPNDTTIILADGSHNRVTGTTPTNANITGNGGNGTLNGVTPPPADPRIILSRVGGPFTVGQEIEFEEVYLSYRLLNGIFADPINTADFYAYSVLMPDDVSLGAPRRVSDTEVRITFVGTPTIANTASASFSGWTNLIPAANFVGAIAPVAARVANNAFLTIPAINKGTGAAISSPPTAASVTHSSITVNALMIPVNPSSQVVQYAINTDSGTTPSSGWQTTLTFTDLTERTVYYVHARSAENANRFAGAVQVSEGIETPCAHANRDPDDFTQCLDCGKTIDPVTVTPNTIILNKGDTHTFNAAVSVPNDAPQDVTWSVIGGVSDTTISAGTLTISANETANTLTVRATLTYNPAIYGEATVTMDFGTVPPTGVPSIMLYVIAFFGFLGISVVAWAFFLRRKLSQKIQKR